MKTSLPLRPVFVLWFVCSGSALAQYMTDTSSTYDDMWFDDTQVYVSGATAGSINVHLYRVYLTLSTPSGTYLTSTPSWNGGYVMNSLSAAWTAADLDADFVGVLRHDYWCTVYSLFPVLLYKELKKRPQKPNYTCTLGLTNVCSDAANGIPPLGPRIDRLTDCKQWNYCCDSENKFVSGWCRIETCEQTPTNAVVSQCMNKTTCQNYLVHAFCP